MMATVAGTPDLDLVRALLARGASPDVACTEGDKDSPVLAAVRRGDVALATELLAATKKVQRGMLRGLPGGEIEVGVRTRSSACGSWLFGLMQAGDAGMHVHRSSRGAAL